MIIDKFTMQTYNLVKMVKGLIKMQDNLLILGAGQYGILVREVAIATGRYEKIDLLDDVSPMAIGAIDTYGDFLSEYRYAFVAIGNSKMRSELLSKLENAGYELPVIISPQAYVSPSAIIGGGSIVEPMAVVNTEAVLGRGCLMCAGAVVNHNAVVEDCCQIDCNATVSARAIVPVGAKIESGCVIK